MAFVDVTFLAFTFLALTFWALTAISRPHEIIAHSLAEARVQEYPFGYTIARV